MNLAIYGCASTLHSAERSHDALASNVANIGVAGFKARIPAIEGQDHGKLPAEIAPNDEGEFEDFLGDVMTQPVTRTDFRPGPMVPTGDATDVALEGPGFFVVEQPEGTVEYTRNGQFTISADGLLVTPSGARVRGIEGNIRLVPGGGELTIDSRGELFQGGNRIARIEIVDFDNRGRLVATEGGFRLPEQNPGAPQRLEEPRVRQGFIEGANTSPMQEMVRLIALTRLHEANQKVISAADQQLGQAVRELTV